MSFEVWQTDELIKWVKNKDAHWFEESSQKTISWTEKTSFPKNVLGGHKGGLRIIE